MKGRIIGEVVAKLSTKIRTPKVCIVGAGPAGFYTAQHLLKVNPEIKVDILERLPVPYGLVRFGVAPDHPEVKNVIHTFEKTAKNSRLKFYGNVSVGKDVSIAQLKDCYNAIVLTYGAEEDRLLNIPGENLSNVLSARRFVGWYNGVPEDRDYKINLDVEEAIIVGQGNVAMDIARILLTPIDKLKTTDITSYSLEQLSRSRVRKVWLVGRRGPLQAAYTIAELRELIKLENCSTKWRREDFSGIKDIVPSLARPKKRITELMLKSLDESEMMRDSRNKSLNPVFLRSPLEFMGKDCVEGVKFSVNILKGDDFLKQTAISTDKVEEISCGIALRSIGYKSVSIDDEVPFDFNNGRVINEEGKVDDQIYSAGWVATGPVGVILTTMTNAFQTGAMVQKNLTDGNKPGNVELDKILLSKNINVVSYENWEKIDAEEIRRGRNLNKCREKIVDVQEMLNVALG